MDLNVIGVICAIIGVLYLIYQFNILPSKETNDMRIVLLAQFASAQTMVDKLITDIETFAIENDCLESIFTQNASFRGQIQHLKEIKSESLSDGLMDKLKTMPLNKELYGAMMASLNEQIKSFHTANAYFNTFRFR
ncbi:MAG: hypothetical protein K2Q33_01945 [Gammaproteobacteria bacterium]|nr:hypothetical protein [Gammaproteobacteria bacterium]